MTSVGVKEARVVTTSNCSNKRWYNRYREQEKVFIIALIEFISCNVCRNYIEANFFSASTNRQCQAPVVPIWVEILSEKNEVLASQMELYRLLKDGKDDLV
jgi:hypothetical protein